MTKYWIRAKFNLSVAECVDLKEPHLTIYEAMTTEKRITGLVHSEILLSPVVSSYNESPNSHYTSQIQSSNSYSPLNYNSQLKAGPFQIIDTRASLPGDAPVTPPRRRYECSNYETCLNLAAALNWDNFTCRGCSGEVDESLLWRARQAFKRDAIVKALCDVPEIPMHLKDGHSTTGHPVDPEPDLPVRVVGKVG